MALAVFVLGLLWNPLTDASRAGVDRFMPRPVTTLPSQLEGAPPLGGPAGAAPQPRPGAEED